MSHSGDGYAESFWEAVGFLNKIGLYHLGMECKRPRKKNHSCLPASLEEETIFWGVKTWRSTKPFSSWRFMGNFNNNTAPPLQSFVMCPIVASLILISEFVLNEKFLKSCIFTRELASSAGLISKIHPHHLNRDF